MLQNLVCFGLLGASVAMSLAIAIVLLRDPGVDGLLRASVIALVATGAVFTAMVGPAGSLLPAWAKLPLTVVAVSGVVFQWSIAHLLFDERYSHRQAVAAPVLLIGGGLLLPVAVGAIFPGLAQTAAVVVALTTFGLIVQMQWMLVVGRFDDLDAYRRLLRLLLAAGAAVFDLLVLASFASDWREPPPASTALWMAAAQIVFKLAWLALTTGQPSPLIRLYRTTHAAEPSPTRALPAPATPSTPSTPSTAAAPVTPGGMARAAAGRHAESIIDAMQSHKLYRRPGLSLGELAAHLGLPEHRVRTAINGHLNFRNYSAFLNHFRLREVAIDLCDPAKAHLPILSLALSAGYASIGPFNRAFREAYGKTPSAFRQAGGTSAACRGPSPGDGQL